MGFAGAKTVRSLVAAIYRACVAGGTYTPGQKPHALSCVERVAPSRGRVWRGHVEITAWVRFAVETNLLQNFRLGASGGGFLASARKSIRSSLKERRCQKAALSLRILSRPQNQPGLYLRGLRTAVTLSTGAGWRIFRGPLHIRRLRAAPSPAGEGLGLHPSGYTFIHTLGHLGFRASDGRSYRANGFAVTNPNFEHDISI